MFGALELSTAWLAQPFIEALISTLIAEWQGLGILFLMVITLILAEKGGLVFEFLQNSSSQKSLLQDF